MKIRSNYVSNSSSSSFVIIYKKDVAMLYDFARFEMFKGYSIFAKDFCEAEDFDTKVFSSIFYIIENYINEIANDFSYSSFNTNNYNQLYDLFELADINIFNPENYIDKAFNKINKLKKNFWNKIKKLDENFYNYMKNTANINNFDFDLFININMDKNDPLYINWNETKNKYEKDIYKYLYSKEFKQGITNDVEKCVNALKEKGYSIKSLQYSDDTNEGAMMENHFMPFLANDPEGKFMILINRCH